MSIAPGKVKGELALELDAHKVSSMDFLKAVESFIGLVKEVTKACGHDLPREAWQVSVSEGSQIIAVHPNEDKIPPRLAAQVANTIQDGLQSLEAGPDNPFGENEKAIEHIKALGKIANRDKRRVPVRCLSGQRTTNVSPSVYKHTQEILSWDYEDAGTVDGVLNVVSAHKGFEFRITDYLHKKSVKCIVDEELMDKALSCFRKRVEVDGLISYSKTGIPRVVRANNILPFPTPEEIPHFSKLKGIFAGK